MEETKSGIGVIGVLFIILVIWAIFGGGFGNGCNTGWGNRGNAGHCGGWYPEGGCSRVSNCEIEKNEIIDSARTQFLIEQNGAATRTAIRDSRDEVMGQASRIYEAQQSEKIFDLKMENMSLKNSIFTKEQIDGVAKQLSDCCCAFNRRLDGIECNMLTKPNLYGVAATCNGQTIPGGFNLLSGCNTCGGNRNI